MIIIFVFKKASRGFKKRKKWLNRIKLLFGIGLVVNMNNAIYFTIQTRNFKIWADKQKEEHQEDVQSITVEQQFLRCDNSTYTINACIELLQVLVFFSCVLIINRRENEKSAKDKQLYGFTDETEHIKDQKKRMR